MKLIQVSMFFAGAALLSACGGNSGMSAANASPASPAASAHTQVTKDFAYQGEPMQKLLVIGVFEDPQLKRIVEEGFAGELRNVGPVAATAHRLYPTDEQLTKETIVATIEDTAVDGVLVVRLKRAGTVETETLRTNAPGRDRGRRGAGYRDGERYVRVLRRVVSDLARAGIFRGCAAAGDGG